MISRLLTLFRPCRSHRWDYLRGTVACRDCGKPWIETTDQHKA